MPERLPRELRALYGLVRSAAGAPAGPERVLERLCHELREGFGLEEVRVVPCDAAVSARALAERRAVVDGATLVVPVLVEGVPRACVAAEVPDRLDGADLELLTALGLLAGVLAEKAARDARSDELKSEYVSTASHELRSPVAVVYGIATTLHLRGDTLTADQERQLRRALFEQSGRLRDLTEQLLDLSRIETGTIVVRPRTFRPREWLDALLPRIAPERHGDVVVAGDPDLELCTDPYAFERVVGNLIANALRYGRPPVIVRWSAGSSFCLSVEDRGTGVPEEFVPDLFGRFTRSESSPETNRLGAGLGLSIARSYAEALGGTLHYEPAEPHGARFVLELPEALPLVREAERGCTREGGMQ